MCDAIVVRAKQGKLQEIVKSGIGSTLNARLMGADKCEEGEEERERNSECKNESKVLTPPRGNRKLTNILICVNWNGKDSKDNCSSC